MNKLIVVSFLFLVFSSGYSQEYNIYSLDIQGNKKTKTSFIKKIIKVSSGSKLDSIVLEDDIKALKRLSSIANASYEVIKSESPENKSCKVVYRIEENYTLIPVANFYKTNRAKLAARLGLYEYNLLGRNIALGGQYQYDIYNSYSLNFRAPFLFNNKLGMAVNHSNLTTEEPLYLAENSSANYRYQNISYELLGLYQVNFNNRFEVGVNVFKEQYGYKDGATADGVPQSLQLDKKLYKFIYEYDNLDYDYQYTSGFKSIFNFQYVNNSSGMASNFLIGWNDFMLFKRIGDKGNWATRLRAGIASNDNTPFSPFALDNNLNIRGVGNKIDRGTGSIVLNTEYRHTLIEKGWFVLQSNLFVDAGSWRKPGGGFDDFVDKKNIKFYPGFGIRLMHKRIFNAVLRIDYGYGLEKNGSNGVVFGIGQYF